MDLRRAAQDRIGGWAVGTIHRLNNRHPWSHNDAFHPWITLRLPPQRQEALDVGCGRGELLALLAEHFEHVHGVDADADMREASSTRCAGLANVTVDATALDDMPAGVDLVTMIAVLHHLELTAALENVRRILNPGGRFLCVGLARPESAIDQAWDLASMITNPIIGYVHHPWPAPDAPDHAPFPVKDPELTFEKIRIVVDRVLPGAQMRRQLAFRHTIAWTKPGR